MGDAPRTQPNLAHYKTQAGGHRPSKTGPVGHTSVHSDRGPHAWGPGACARLCFTAAAAPSKKCPRPIIDRRRRRRRSRYPPHSLLRCLPHSLQDQRSLAGTSNAKGAGVTLPHGTTRGSSSRAATRRRSHRPTARRQGGWDALRCPCRPASSLQQALELRSGHRRAPCPPSQGACASRSLWQGLGMSC